jgi:4-hydroxybutyrate CoA-transferase
MDPGSLKEKPGMQPIHPEDLTDILGPRVAIGLGNACAEPQTLIDALINGREAFEAVEIYGMIHYWTDRLLENRLASTFKLNVFMVDRYTVKGIQKGFTDYIPCRYSKIPELFHKGHIRLDAALISVSPPDASGYCTYGVSADFTKSMAENADRVVAEINEQMPRVYGDNRIHIDRIDYVIESDRQLPQVNTPELTDMDRRIGENVARLIDDGATIQIGIGRLSEATLASLRGKKSLGIHSGLLTDGMVDLMEKGIVDNSCKGVKNGKMVGTTMIGTDKLFRFVRENTAVESYPSDFTHDSVMLSKLTKLHAINSAIQVDLTGQINAETIGGIQVSGVGGQTDFICGAGLSKGGKSIIVISSTRSKGDRSRIVPFLDHGASVTSLRHDIDYVVTEYGIADLKGKTLAQRAKALIRIAHPKFRDALESHRRKQYSITPRM